jgi:hypothetical protein
MHIDRESGKVLGAIESPGHEISLAADRQIYIASLTGNVFQWYPAGPDGWGATLKRTRGRLWARQRQARGDVGLALIL